MYATRVEDCKKSQKLSKSAAIFLTICSIEKDVKRAGVARNGQMNMLNQFCKSYAESEIEFLEFEIIRYSIKTSDSYSSHNAVVLVDTSMFIRNPS